MASFSGYYYDYSLIPLNNMIFLKGIMERKPNIINLNKKEIVAALFYKDDDVRNVAVDIVENIFEKNSDELKQYFFPALLEASKDSEYPKSCIACLDALLKYLPEDDVEKVFLNIFDVMNSGNKEIKENLIYTVSDFISKNGDFSSNFIPLSLDAINDTDPDIVRAGYFLASDIVAVNPKTAEIFLPVAEKLLNSNNDKERKNYFAGLVSLFCNVACFEKEKSKKAFSLLEKTIKKPFDDEYNVFVSSTLEFINDNAYSGGIRKKAKLLLDEFKKEACRPKNNIGKGLNQKYKL